MAIFSFFLKKVNLLKLQSKSRTCFESYLFSEIVSAFYEVNQIVELLLKVNQNVALLLKIN
jgi:predicted nucleotidyltransferase